MKAKRFTLVELAVITAVIAILAGMLLPALSHTIQESTVETCAANLKQIGVFAAMYVTDNNDALCPIESYEIVNNQQKFTGKVWTKLLNVYMKDTKIDGGYLTQGGVLTCPDFGERQPFKGYPRKSMYEAVRPDYGINAYGPGQKRGFGTQIEKRSQVKEPAAMIYFGDCVNTDFNGRLGTLNILSYAYVGFRHDNKANFGFIDGHVDAKTAEEVHYKGKDAAKRLPWSQYWK